VITVMTFLGLLPQDSSHPRISIHVTSVQRNYGFSYHNRLVQFILRGLFNDAFQYSEYIASDGRLTDE
jgi:hypothetical protein